MKEWEECSYLRFEETYEPTDDGTGEVKTGEGYYCECEAINPFSCCKKCPARFEGD